MGCLESGELVEQLNDDLFETKENKETTKTKENKEATKTKENNSKVSLNVKHVIKQSSARHALVN
jgi:hypothetical protein